MSMQEVLKSDFLGNLVYKAKIVGIAALSGRNTFGVFVIRSLHNHLLHGLSVWRIPL